MPFIRMRVWLAFGLAAVIWSGERPTAQVAGAQQASALPASGSLGTLLTRYAEFLPLDVRLDPRVASAPVDCDVAGLSPYAALREVLLASGVDYVIVQKGERLSLVAGDASEAVLLEGPNSRLPEVSDAASADARRAEAPDNELDAETQSSPLSAAGTGGNPGGGAMSPADMASILHGATAPTSGQSRWVDLPFPDEQGQPVRVWKPAGMPPVVELPFPDAAGQPVIQVVPARPLGIIELPFPGPDGLPVLQGPPLSAVPASSRTPGSVVRQPPV